LYALNFITAIIVGLCDFLFLVDDNLDKQVSTMRSYAYTLINAMWWLDTGLILLAITRIRKYANSSTDCQLNMKQLYCHLVVCILFSICAIPICILQLFESNFYGEFFFMMQTVQTVVAGIAILVMYWIFNHICDEAIQVKSLF
jgi:hypothetical protein